MSRREARDWGACLNHDARRFYRARGFRECGRLSRQVRIDGIADDEVLLDLFLRRDSGSLGPSVLINADLASEPPPNRGSCTILQQARLTRDPIQPSNCHPLNSLGVDYFSSKNTARGEPLVISSISAASRSRCRVVPGLTCTVVVAPA